MPESGDVCFTIHPLYFFRIALLYYLAFQLERRGELAVVDIPLGRE